MDKTFRTIVLTLALLAGAGAGAPRAQESQGTEKYPVPATEDGAVRTVRMDTVLMKLSHMTVHDYMSIELPPIELLFENAKKSPQARYYEFETEFYRRDIITERMKPLEWIRAVGSYSYGNTDLAAVSLMETTYQIWTQNQSTQQSMYYNIGVTMAIPLIDIADYGNKIKKNKAKMLQTKYRQEAEMDALRQEIIELYCNVISLIETFKAVSEMKTMAEAQYHFAENDFVNNTVTSEALYRSKNYETGAVKDYNETRRNLNTALLTLELVSCTPIVSNLTIREE